MALIAQFDKFAVITKRSTSFVPEGSKTGVPQEYNYVTGIDCTSGACFSDVAIPPESPVNFNSIEENTVYDCQFVTSVIRGEKNATRLSAIKLVQRIGTIGVNLDKPGK
ncbi:MAG: hypothetical protein SPM09_06835 [Fibrobacter sp.]|uniref:hypothetical protein n=1 Tax=Fibrobacter sp. TaxID=35828 RepID=UPI002A911B0E|nr:hypothetical protein [Fibrobacter sp.]MDY6264104.1 hypothetical protein [Fibrobacter sp.]